MRETYGTIQNKMDQPDIGRHTEGVKESVNN